MQRGTRGQRKETHPVRDQEGLIEGRRGVGGVDQSSGPQRFWRQGPVSWKTIFPRIGGEGVVGMVQAVMRAMGSGR